MKRAATGGGFGAARHWMVLAATALVACLAGPAAQAAPGAGDDNRSVSVAPPPAWVRPVEPAPVPEAQPGSGETGTEYLLFDYQVRTGPGPRQSWLRFVMRASSAQGVNRLANLEMGFDPSYQHLTLHHVDIVRDGKRLARLDRTRVRLLQREPGLEQQVLDGRRTAHLVLEDVRIGDVIDYAYTLTGTNPVFGDARFGRFDQMFSTPVARLHQRLLVPSGTPMHVTLRNAAIAAEPQTLAAHTEWLWQRDAVPAMTVERDAPHWHDPYPSVDWGVYGAWKDVVAWALPLYTAPPAGPLLKAQAQRIAAAHTSPEDRTRAVLRFLQAEVRYLAVSLGTSSHRPTAPETVLRRRYGDCKDKTLLMVSLLRELGIAASPALVNLEVGPAIASRQPSPGVFDHVIVRALVDGVTFWLDPTLAPQGGRLNALTQAAHGRALVVHPDTSELTVMPQPPAGANRRDIQVTLDASQGPGHAALMTVQSNLSGVAADRARHELSTESRATLAKTYLNFYANHFTGVEALGPPEVQDNRDFNTLVLTERYRIAEPWEQAPGKSRRQLVIPSAELQEYLHRNTARVREAPLALPQGLHVSVTTRVRVHEDYAIPPSKLEISDSALRFTADARWLSKREVLVSDSIEFVADHVPSGAVTQHLEQLDKMRGNLGYVLFEQGAPLAWSPGGLLFVATTALLAVGAAIWIWRWDPVPRALQPGDEDWRGIGGWLWVFAVGAVVTPMLWTWLLWQALSTLGVDHWNMLTQPGGSAQARAEMAATLVTLTMAVSQLIFSVPLAMLLFLRRTSFPVLWIGSSVLLVAFDWILLTLASAVAPEHPLATQGPAQPVATTLSVALWSAYLLRSRRVRATLTQRRVQPPVIAPVALNPAPDPASG